MSTYLLNIHIVFIVFLIINLYFLCARKTRAKVIRRKIIILEIFLMSNEDGLKEGRDREMKRKE